MEDEGYQKNNTGTNRATEPCSESADETYSQDNHRVAGSSRVEIARLFRWPTVVIIGCLIILIAYIWTIHTTREVTKDVRDTVKDMGEHMEGVAEKFLTGDITSHFLAALPKLSSAGIGNLELATSTVTETFKQTDERWILWDSVSLGQTVTEIKVPVTYRYHVRLSDSWKIEVDHGNCMVMAPCLRASLPPAIHTDKMEKRTDSGWLRFNADEQMTELEKTITPTLTTYASDQRHLDFVREECRKTIARFVLKWLLMENVWREDGVRSIVIVFEDEKRDPVGALQPAIWFGEGDGVGISN